MTPTTADILAGNARVIAGLADAAGGPEFTGAKLGVVAMLSVLAAQEAERGVAARVAENADIRTVLGESGDDGDLTITALDAANAGLRRRLIALHERVEEGSARERELLALYRRMAAGHVLVLPAM